MYVLELKWTLPFATYKLAQSSRQTLHTWNKNTFYGEIVTCYSLLFLLWAYVPCILIHVNIILSFNGKAKKIGREFPCCFGQKGDVRVSRDKRDARNRQKLQNRQQAKMVWNYELKNSIVT